MSKKNYLNTKKNRFIFPNNKNIQIVKMVQYEFVTLLRIERTHLFGSAQTSSGTCMMTNQFCIGSIANKPLFDWVNLNKYQVNKIKLNFNKNFKLERENLKRLSTWRWILLQQVCFYEKIS